MLKLDSLNKIIGNMKNKKIAFVIIIFSVLVLTFVLFFFSYPPSTVNQTQKDIEKIVGFLENYKFKHLNYTVLTNQTLNLSSCFTLFFGKIAVQSPRFLEQKELNFSIFNTSLPLYTYVRIDLVPQEYLNEYYNEFQEKHYACNPVPSLFSNPNVVPIHYKGIYAFCFYNFTDQGLRDMGVPPYVGNKPNLYFCFANTMYKNIRISYGEWGFVESQNLTAFLNSANATIEEFISSYSN
jgi:hypothetical protein